MRPKTIPCPDSECLLPPLHCPNQSKSQFVRTIVLFDLSIDFEEFVDRIIVFLYNDCGYDYSHISNEGERMQTISKSKLKAQMLRIFRELEDSGEELIVTDRRRPVLRILPIARKKTVEEAFGAIQGRVIYHEDIDLPTSEKGTDV